MNMDFLVLILADTDKIISYEGCYLVNLQYILFRVVI